MWNPIKEYQNRSSENKGTNIQEETQELASKKSIFTIHYLLTATFPSHEDNDEESTMISYYSNMKNKNIKRRQNMYL